MRLMLCYHNKTESDRLGYQVVKGGVILITKFRLITKLPFTSDLNT